MSWIQCLAGILSGLAVCLPLAVKLIQTVTDCVTQRSWGAIMQIVMQLMSQAEENFDRGSDRREWVITMAKKSADLIGFPMDEKNIGALIDSLCAMAKNVNS